MSDEGRIFNQADLSLAVVGLGYVGLPLAVEFSRFRHVIAYDNDAIRIDELSCKIDRTNEVSEKEIESAYGLELTCESRDLEGCNCYIVAVPTPIDRLNEPDLSSLLSASEMLGKMLSPGDLVIFESTVYPGVTEEFCSPILAKHSGLTCASKTMPPGSDVFYLGYSPERVNPGDKCHRLTQIVKVTSGSTPEIADLVDDLYASIIKAGTHRAPSIKVAEAAKVIENTQRDVNIALINELAVIFKKLGIDTNDILEAAGTKWNFLQFYPGLVGGHCIGVDPFYLTYKARQLGHHPEIILAGRRINDHMASYVAEQVIKLMQFNRIFVQNSRILVLGLTFKENCPDTRNSKVVDLVNAFAKSCHQVDVYDPLVRAEAGCSGLNGTLVDSPAESMYDAIVLAVPHNYFIASGPKNIRRYGKPNHVFFDMKSVFPASASDGRL